jgi:hypothetical protein
MMLSNQVFSYRTFSKPAHIIAGKFAIIVPTAGCLKRTRAMCVKRSEGERLKCIRQGQKMKVKSQKMMISKIWTIETKMKSTI